MTRLYEFIVALIIVVILALIVGIALPSTGHIQRSVTVSKDIRHVYDLFNNYRRFPDYSMQSSYDPHIQYQQTPDKWYGPGAGISWTSSNPQVGNGSLTLVSAKPNFDEVETQGQATFVWDLKNQWHGTNKRFTIHLERTGRSQKLVTITWGYDVDYGWNLVNRYSGLYIHGSPDTLIKFSLHNLQNILASIPNIAYDDLDPKIVSTPQQPVLLVSTSAKRNLTDVGAASDKAVNEILAAMKKLGVHAVGPRIRFTTNYGDTNYSFDVAIPIDSDTLTIDGKQYTLSAPHAPEQEAAAASTTAGAASVAAAGSSEQPASAASAGKAGAEPAGPQPGSLDKHGRLVVNADVRGMLAFGGKALQGVWYGSPAGIPPTRLRLEAYADTHGYPYDAVNHRPYDKQIAAYGDPGPDGKPLAFDQQTFRIFLPLSAAPEQTPEQAAGMEPANPFAKPASAGSAPANAASAPAAAATAD